MYESKFGLSGNPFSLNPDPAFYFGSRGHAHALAYLKFGVFQSEGFIVVTGEIGAGKTTLVRTLLSELDPQKVVAAQIVSTQLEAGDLLRSVAAAFGLATAGLSKAELIATIEAFLTFQASQQRRPLLVVDEAQNLGLGAVEELRMLSNFQLGNQALLQSFLVGQPELRALLASKAMEQFRQRVIASCHLGPMEPAETAQYVQHRLRHVGWTGQPAFQPDALDAIHVAAGGVPRRINLLCNRVLLAAFLNAAETIDAGSVATAAAELASEIGAGAVPAQEGDGPGQAARHAAERRPAVPKFAAASVADRRRPVLVVAGSVSEDLKALALLEALNAHDAVPPAFAVRLSGAEPVHLGDAAYRAAELDDRSATMTLQAASADARLVEAMERLLPLMQRERPAAVVVTGGSTAALAASLLARKSGSLLVRVASTVRIAAGGATRLLDNQRLIEAISDVAYTTEASPREVNRQDAELISRGEAVGNLMLDGLNAVFKHRMAPDFPVRPGQAPGVPSQDGGFGIVTLCDPLMLADRERTAATVGLLQAISRDVRLVWTAGDLASQAIQRHGLTDMLRESWIDIVAPQDYLVRAGLLQMARFLVCDAAEDVEQADACGLRSLWVSAGAAPQGRLVTALAPAADGRAIDRAAWAAVLETVPSAKPPRLWDGRTAGRVAEHLAGLLGDGSTPAGAELRAWSA